MDSVVKWFEVALTITKNKDDKLLLSRAHEHYMIWTHDEMKMKGVSIKKLATAFRERNLEEGIKDGRIIFLGVKLNWEELSRYTSRAPRSDEDYPF